MYYRNLDHGDALSDLFQLIERKAPLFMIAGGCGLTTAEQDRSHNGKPLPEEVKARFAQLVQQGKNLREIATLTGWPYSTVVKHTRQVRRAAA